jgi:hypothetical protein
MVGDADIIPKMERIVKELDKAQKTTYIPGLIGS